MTSRLVFESWQILFAAGGFAVFASVFAVKVVSACRMKAPRLERLQNLPLSEESSRPASHVRPEKN